MEDFLKDIWNRFLDDPKMSFGVILGILMVVDVLLILRIFSKFGWVRLLYRKQLFKLLMFPFVVAFVAQVVYRVVNDAVFGPLGIYGDFIIACLFLLMCFLLHKNKEIEY